MYGKSHVTSEATRQLTPAGLPETPKNPGLWSRVPAFSRPYIEVEREEGEVYLDALK
ncbi:unnamed protein product [Dibothriocephalus latus]|uniref:Uncharacterized protein n=1 Tax=Dibothriocephalus latus TaxID=60516 RepID=A0A3P7PSM9_DIBLA|nr:unnamed protein product [Dibothriocephalus latus]